MLHKLTKSRIVAQSLLKTSSRSFAAQGVITQELEQHLTRLNVTQHHRIVHNPS